MPFVNATHHSVSLEILKNLQKEGLQSGVTSDTI